MFLHRSYYPTICLMILLVLSPGTVGAVALLLLLLHHLPLSIPLLGLHSARTLGTLIFSSTSLLLFVRLLLSTLRDNGLRPLIRLMDWTINCLPRLKWVVGIQLSAFCIVFGSRIATLGYFMWTKRVRKEPAATFHDSASRTTVALSPSPPPYTVEHEIVHLANAGKPTTRTRKLKYECLNEGLLSGGRSPASSKNSVRGNGRAGGERA